MRLLANVFKRSMDVFFSFILILAFTPFICLFSFLIYIYDKKFPLFIQKRIGYQGKPFNLIKLRSMSPTTTRSYDQYYTFHSDPRITPIGHFIRRFSIDEFPQLFNILIGDMSFVGPRPAVIDEFEYEELSEASVALLEARTTVLPGLTGFAQVRGRNSLSWEEKLVYDGYYIKMNPLLRLFFDLFLLVNTFFILFSAHGSFDSPRN